MITGVSLAQVVMPSIDKGGPGAGGLIFETFVLADDAAIYAKGNTNAGADDCKFIQQILGGYAQPTIDDADHTLLAISSDETADDLATITTATGTTCPLYVLLWGVGAEGTPA